MKKTILLIMTLIFTSCNVYELTGQENQYSNEFKDLLSGTRVHQNIHELSISTVNSVTTVVTFNIENGIFTAVPIPTPTGFSTNPVVSAAFINSKTVTVSISGGSVSISGSEAFIDVDFSAGYIPDNGINMQYETRNIKISN